MTSPFKQVARELHAKGLSVIPLKPKSKIPAIKDWSKYSDQLPTIEDIEEWEQIKDANIGLVLGKASNLIGLDFDYDRQNMHQAVKDLLTTQDTIVKTGHKGCTMFFKYQNEESRGWAIKGETILDLLSDKRHTVLPPSIHPEGDIYSYESIDTLEDTIEVPKLPVKFVPKVDKLFGKTDEKKEDKNLDVDIEEVRTALTFIDNTGYKIDYDTWVSVGMALKSDLGEAGLPLWREWSARSTKFIESSIDIKWNSFNRSGITLGTVFKKALDNGFEFSKDKVNLEGIVTPLELIDELEQWRTDGIDRGVSSGYDNLDKLIHFKRGEFVVWTGYANNGKSEMLDTISLALMKKGWRFLYCSLEKLPKSHIQSLVHKITKTPIEERTKEQQLEAIKFLDSQCAMIGRKDFKPTIDNIYKMALIYKNVYGLDALVIDPFNYIQSPNKGNLFEHVAYILERCTFIAQTLGIHVAMVAHPKKPDKTFGGELPDLTMYSISGSADFANMADIIVAVYRDKHNINRLDVLKVRDQDVDRTGSCEFTFDTRSKNHKPYDVLEF